MTDPRRSRVVPAVLAGVDGEPPVYVSRWAASSPDRAVAYAVRSGEIAEPPEGETYDVHPVLMRALDPIACKIRGVEDGWWVECTTRSKTAEPFWRIDD